MRKMIFNIPEELMPSKEINNKTGDTINYSKTEITASNSYQKGHNVPEGWYLVRLIDVKCHSKDRYKLTVEILENAIGHKPYPTKQVIVGYSDRTQKGFYDLGNCFSNGILHSRATKYIGETGIIHLTHSGWIELEQREFNKDYFPDAKNCERPSIDWQQEFDNYLNRFR